MQISHEVLKLKDEVVRLRRQFHQHPELGWNEHKTAEQVEAHLLDLGLEVTRITETGVVGLLKGAHNGPTLLLRADMDALPISEQTGLPFASCNEGVMHACAHDGHMAMLLAAARVLSGYQSRLRGNIKFVFQPNEENVGAKAMIEEGVLEDPQVDACMGQHLWCPLPVGQIGLTAGPVMAGMDHFHLTVEGKGGHTATPQETVDPIICAANIIQSVQNVQTRELDALKPVIIMFGQIQGGTASNVVPDEVELAGTLRYLCDSGPQSEENPQGRMERIIQGLCQAYGTKHELSFSYGHPALINDPTLIELVRATACACDIDPNSIESFVTLAGEDFSEFASRIPGVFYFIGAGNRENACYPHHHPMFDFDESALTTGVEMHVRTALAYLGQD